MISFREGNRVSYSKGVELVKKTFTCEWGNEMTEHECRKTLYFIVIFNRVKIAVVNV